MNTEDEEFNRIEREASMRMVAVKTTVSKHQCNWPACQSEQYQQALAEQIKQELVTGAAQQQWISLTENEHVQIAIEAGCMGADWVFYGAAVERKSKEKNAAAQPVTTARWYCIDKIGVATLCADEDDAIQNARQAEKDWPNNAPYRAVQLCELAR